MRLSKIGYKSLIIAGILALSVLPVLAATGYFVNELNNATGEATAPEYNAVNQVFTANANSTSDLTFTFDLKGHRDYQILIYNKVGDNYSSLCKTSVQNVNSDTFATYNFNITGCSIVSGNEYLVQLSYSGGLEAVIKTTPNNYGLFKITNSFPPSGWTNPPTWAFNLSYQFTPPPPPPPPPTIDSFTATPSSIVPGDNSTLAWATSNATSCSINQGIGSVSNTGSQIVSPAVSTIYTITCDITATADATITVSTPPPPPPPPIGNNVIIPPPAAAAILTNISDQLADEGFLWFAIISAGIILGFWSMEKLLDLMPKDKQ